MNNVGSVPLNHNWLHLYSCFISYYRRTVNEEVKNKVKSFRGFRSAEYLQLNHLDDRTLNNVNGGLHIDGCQQWQTHGTCALLAHDVQVGILSNIRVTQSLAKSSIFTSRDINFIATKS